MKTNELTKDTRVEVTNGLWKGFVGTIEEIHPEASVVRLKNDAGDTAYAFKTDVKAV